VGIFEQGGEYPMPSMPDPERSARIEAGKTVTQRAPDVKGTFYCQAGDHIVDHIVWLETITLGCRPCMEKLGKEISRTDWMPRLWSVTPAGTKRAKDIPHPRAEQYIREHQHWACVRCGRSRDTMDGVYNTASGFICMRCVGPTHKLGQDKETLLQRAARLENERRRGIIARTVTRQADLAKRYGLDYVGWDERDKRWIEDHLDKLINKQLITKQPSDRRWPEHRDAQLAQIPNLKIAQSTDARPNKGRVGEWVYVNDQDQLFTWLQDAGWIRVGLPARPESNPVVRARPRTYDDIAAEMRAELRAQRFGPPFSQQICNPGQHRYRHGERRCDRCGTVTYE
jgi:hypothetical protein